MIYPICDNDSNLAKSVKRYIDIKNAYEQATTNNTHERDVSQRRVSDLEIVMNLTRDKIVAYKARLESIDGSIDEHGCYRNKIGNRVLNNYIDNMCFIDFKLKAANGEIVRIEHDFSNYKIKLEVEMDAAFNDMMKIAYA